MESRVTVRLYAEARDIAGTGKIILEIGEAPQAPGAIFSKIVNATNENLFDVVFSRGGDGSIVLGKGYKLMVNNVIVEMSIDTKIMPGDEVGILPPFSGG